MGCGAAGPRWQHRHPPVQAPLTFTRAGRPGPSPRACRSGPELDPTCMVPENTNQCTPNGKLSQTSQSQARCGGLHVLAWPEHRGEKGGGPRPPAPKVARWRDPGPPVGPGAGLSVGTAETRGSAACRPFSIPLPAPALTLDTRKRKRNPCRSARGPLTLHEVGGMAPRGCLLLPLRTGCWHSSAQLRMMLTPFPYRAVRKKKSPSLRAWWSRRDGLAWLPIRHRGALAGHAVLLRSPAPRHTPSRPTKPAVASV